MWLDNVRARRQSHSPQVGLALALSPGTVARDTARMLGGISKVFSEIYRFCVGTIGYGAFVVLCIALPVILGMVILLAYFRHQQQREAERDDRRNSLDLLERGQLKFVRNRSLPTLPVERMTSLRDGGAAPDREATAPQESRPEDQAPAASRLASDL